MHGFTVPMHRLILTVWSNMRSLSYLETFMLRHEHVVEIRTTAVGIQVYQYLHTPRQVHSPQLWTDGTKQKITRDI